MRHFYRKHHRWLRWLPRKKHLHGGWLHRRLGERLFHPDLWAPTRRGTSLGLALGTFIALTPTMGAQFILAGVVAYLLRVNLPISLAACLITNPLSAPFVYGAQYQLGIWLVGLAPPSELEGYAGVMRSVMRHGKPMWVGSLVVGSIGALLSIVVVNALWPKYEALQQIRATNRAVKKARASGASSATKRRDEIVPEPD